MIHLRVHGLASGTVVAEFPLSEQDLETDLLTLLRSKDIPIASSCLGEGVCRKCLINDDLMACITKPSELISQGETIVHVNVSYL